MDESEAGLLPDVIRGVDALDTSVQVVEVLLDSLMKDGILRDIPGGSIILSILKSTLQWRDKAYLETVDHFLRGLDRQSLRSRAEFVSKHTGSLREQKRFASTIVRVLEHSEDADKATMLARIVIAYVLGRIDLRTTLRFSSILDRIPSVDFKDLYLAYLKKKIDWNVGPGLASFGLVHVSAEDLNDLEQTEYAISRYGVTFVEVAILGAAENCN